MTVFQIVNSEINSLVSDPVAEIYSPLKSRPDLWVVRCHECGEQTYRLSLSGCLLWLGFHTNPDSRESCGRIVTP